MRYTKVRVALTWISDDNIEHTTAFEYVPEVADTIMEMAILKRSELIGKEYQPTGDPFF